MKKLWPLVLAAGTLVIVSAQPVSEAKSSPRLILEDLDLKASEKSPTIDLNQPITVVNPRDVGLAGVAVFWAISLAILHTAALKVQDARAEAEGRGLPSEGLWPIETDALFTLALLLGTVSEKYDCLNRMACLYPDRASGVLDASYMVLKGAKVLQPISGYSTERYENIISAFHDAVDYSRDGGKCDAKYVCSSLT